MMSGSLLPSPSLLLLLLLLLPTLPSAWAANQPTESMVFPGPHPEAYRSLSLIISLIGVSVLSFCIARRPAGFRVDASRSQRLLATLLIDSWMFIFSSALMTSGIGLSLNSNICTGAIFICILFYGFSKALIYMFLAERVYTVHAGTNRLESTAHRISQVFLVGFCVVFALGTWGRIAFLRDGTTHAIPFTQHIMDGTDNACVIGLAGPATISLLVYDLFLNVLFTSLFLYPLYRSHMLTTPLRKLAKSTLWAALVALVTSATNIAILTVVHGQQLGWVCLGSCGTDVTINALALFFVTRSYDDTGAQEPIDTVTRPVICPRPVTPTLHTSEYQQGLASHRSFEFPVTERAGRCATIDYEMNITSETGTGSRWATNKLSTTVGSVNDGVEKPKDQPNDSYINPTGMVTSESGETGNVQKKPSIDLADVDGVDMPTCSTTPDGEETEVQTRSEGRPPRAQSGSHSRANSWSGGRLPSARPDLDPDLEAGTRGADKALFRAAGSNNYDEGGVQTSSSSMVVVSVRTPTEEYVDPVLEPRFDPDQRRWRNLKRSSVLVEHKEDLETGL